MSGTRYDLKVAATAERVLNQITARGTVDGEVLTRLTNLPVMLRVSGVPATLAFYDAKAAKDDGPLAKAYRDVCTALWSELRHELRWPDGISQPYGELSRCSGTDLARAFQRLEALAGWLNRLAAALEREQKLTEAKTASTDDRAGSPDQSTGTSS